MVGQWFTTPWRLVSQSHGAVAWRFRSACPSHVPFPFASSRHRPVPSVPWTPYPVWLSCGPSRTPFPALYPCPIIPCLYPTGSPATPWRGPIDPLPSGDRFVRLARVAPFPPPSHSLVPRPRPNLLGCCAAPSHPSSSVFTPPGRQQPCGAGPPDPHPSGDRFVHLARVAPFPPFSAVPRPRSNPLGCCAGQSHPSSRFYTPPGRQQACGAGPLDPHPSGDRFVRLARVSPLPPPPLTPVLPPIAHRLGRAALRPGCSIRGVFLSFSPRCLERSSPWHRVLPRTIQSGGLGRAPLRPGCSNPGHLFVVFSPLPRTLQSVEPSSPPDDPVRGLVPCFIPARMLQSGASFYRILSVASDAPDPGTGFTPGRSSPGASAVLHSGPVAPIRGVFLLYSLRCLGCSSPWHQVHPRTIQSGG